LTKSNLKREPDKNFFEGRDRFEEAPADPFAPESRIESRIEEEVRGKNANQSAIEL